MNDILLNDFKIKSELLEEFNFRKEYIIFKLRGKHYDEAFFKEITTKFQKDQKISLKIFGEVFDKLLIKSSITTIRTGDNPECECQIVFENKNK